MAQRAGWSERLESLEVKVAAACASSEAVEVIRSGELVDLYPVDEYEDEYAQRLGNVPFTSDFFSALGTMLVRRMWTVAENRYKVIAMDCDHVLWNGACEPGDRARVDEGRLALQRSLRAMSSAGVLLCLCTTRPERDVWASFENNREMIIGRDDLVASAAGCKTSAEGLRGLADELGLGLDSFIFLHADPAECAAVEAACPEALTLQVPEDSSAIPEWLRHVWAFDAAQKAGAKIDEGSPCQ
jgi:predicted enzyme involved in methoxymalonyl-ACP biosynthesis